MNNPAIDFKKVTIREYRPGDEQGIALLINSSDSRHVRNISYLHWSNSGNVNRDFVSVIAEYEGAIVGHYSLMAVDVIYRGQKFRAGYGQQAVVHKKFRNLLVACALAEFAFKNAKQKYSFLFAFPNENFFKVKTTLLSWHSVGVFSAEVINLSELYVKVRDGISVLQLAIFDEKVRNIFCNQESESDLITFYKDDCFLNWRFFSHPLNYYPVFGAFVEGEFVGYIVLKFYYDAELFQTVGHLIDYEVKDANPDFLCALLNVTKDFFSFNGVEKIVFWNRNQKCRDFFKKFISSEEFGFSSNLAMFFCDQNFSNEIIDLSKWSFMMAQSDAF